MTIPLSGVVFHPYVETCYGKTSTKLEVSIFIRYGYRKGEEKSRKWAGLG